MTAKKDFHIVASINIGANYLHMIIAEINSDKKFNILEDLTKPSNIGRDTYSSKRISIETIQQTCNDLKGFAMLMKDYRIKTYKAVSTSGIREAENREYIVEQIRLSSGIKVDIINTAEESLLNSKALRSHMPKSGFLTADSSLVVNVTSGGMEISMFKKGSLDYTEYMKLGSLRLSEILSDLETMTMDFPKIMEEFIESKIHILKPRIQSFNAVSFIGIGGELDVIAKLCGRESHNTTFIERDQLFKLYEKMKSMSSNQIIQTYGINRKEAKLILPSVILFKCFISLTKAPGIYAPMLSLCHGLLSNMAENLYDENSDNDEIINYAWYIADKYCIDKTHLAYIEKISLQIFDATMRLHKLDSKERLYLRVAAILHNVGKFVNFSEPDMQTYDIILNQKVMGFSKEKLVLIANIARYHGQAIPSHKDENYLTLSEKEKITVSKLVAILKLAESIDISHKQKISHIEINLSQDKLLFKIKSTEDTLLEEWDFIHNALFFHEVMGIKPEFKRRG